MITLPQLKALLKYHNIQCSYINKDEIIALRMDKQIITAEDILTPTVVAKNSDAVKLDADLSKCAHLKGIRTNPKAFQIYDMETNEVTVYVCCTKNDRYKPVSHIRWENLERSIRN